jgi:hypothetical protein
MQQRVRMMVTGACEVYDTNYQLDKEWDGIYNIYSKPWDNRETMFIDSNSIKDGRTAEEMWRNGALTSEEKEGGCEQHTVGWLERGFSGGVSALRVVAGFMRGVS